MIRVLNIIQQLSLGGAARAMIATSKYSSRLDDVTYSVASLAPAEKGAVELAREAGMDILSAPDTASLEYAMAQADVVLIHWWNHPQVNEFLRSALPAMRLAIWVHVAGEHPPQVLTKELVQFADFLIPGSPHTFERSVIQDLPSSIRAEKVEMIYDAADFDRCSGLIPKAHPTFNVGYIGTVDFIKMHPRYVHMSAAVKVPSARFIVCGGGIQELLREQARRLGAEERFLFCGYVLNIREVLESLDVYGYPLCEDTYAAAELNLQEVMFAGIPPVVFPHGGLKRLVINNETGLVVNSEREYQEAIEFLYHNPMERARLGRNAKKYAEEFFGAENAAKKLNPLLHRMIREPKRRRNWICQTGLSPLFEKEATRGTGMFLDSLGKFNEPFLASINSDDIDLLFKAESCIANSSALLRSAAAGGIVHYRQHFLNDRYLQLWTGLILMREGKFLEAISEFSSAMNSGCHHYRIPWYIYQAAKCAGLLELCEKALILALKLSPHFEMAKEALELLRRQKRCSSTIDIPPSPPMNNGNRGTPPGIASNGHPQLISAIVSTYNSERFIRGCLEDLIAQTLYPKGLLEIVVVNTGSQQNERAIVEEFQMKYRHIVHIHTEDRKNLYQAWNIGAKAAKGKYLTNANTDDRHRPDMLERMANVLEAYPQFGLVYANSLITGHENATWSDARPVGVISWPDYNPRQIFDFCPIGPHPMWRRSVHDQIGFFDESYVSAGDYEFWLRMSRAGIQMLHIPEALGLYLYNCSGISLSDMGTSVRETEKARDTHWPPQWGPRPPSTTGANIVPVTHEDYPGTWTAPEPFKPAEASSSATLNKMPILPRDGSV